MFSLNKQESLDAIVNTLTLFENNTSLRLNYDKTSVHRIGSFKDTNAKLYSMEPLNWTNEPINILGIIKWLHDIQLWYVSYVATMMSFWKDSQGFAPRI